MQHSIKTVKVGERDLELFKMNSIQSQFPVKFKEGMTYETLQVCCAECNIEIKDDDFRGSVTPVLENMTQVEARGFCSKCKLITPVNYRLYSDGRLIGLQNGKWQAYQMKEDVPLWRKILKFLFW